MVARPIIFSPSFVPGGTHGASNAGPNIAAPQTTFTSWPPPISATTSLFLPFGQRRDADHARRHDAGKVLTHRLNAFALGRLHGDEALQPGRLGIQTRDQFAQPVVGELHLVWNLELTQETQIAAHQMANIVNAITHHRQAA